MVYKLKPTRVFRAYHGGENLDKLNKKSDVGVSRFPEDWLGSVTTAFNPDRQVVNEGLTETCDGRILKDLILSDKENMIGRRENMSLLFKLLDSAERLVIQVHPTREFAMERFGSPYGKTECWYMLGDGGYVYLGFKEGITKEYWKKLFDKQDVDAMLSCLHRFDVKCGDFIFVAGGVPHAIGAGCFLAELQEPTDLMVIPERVTPSGVVLAEEKLHGGLGFDHMFDCFVYEGLSRDEVKRRYFITPKEEEGRLVLADSEITDKFKLDKLVCSGSSEFETHSYAIVLVIKGCGEINGTSVIEGDRLFLPESESKLSICGDMEILLARP